MNIQTNLTDVIEAPPGSVESISSKSMSSDSDSLEYSNDDHSEQRRKLMASNSKYDVDTVSRPPKYPALGSAESAMHSSDTNLNSNSNQFTPKRTNKPPGPLHLFSPGLSPIGHSHGNYYDDDDREMLNDSRNKAEAGADSAAAGVDDQDDISLNDSIDSLEISNRFDQQMQAAQIDKGGPHQRRNDPHDSPNYRYWKNKLFGDDNEPADESFLSVDSDMNITKQTLIYPTTDAVYNQSEMPLRSNNNSFDSDMNVTKQSLVYPTTAALYERSEVSQLQLNNSMDSDAHVSKQSLVYPSTDTLYQQVSAASTPTHKGATANEADLTKQSFILPAPIHMPMSPTTPQNTTMNMSYLSLLNTSGYASADGAPTERSLLSVSLLPPSPLAGPGRKQLQPGTHGRAPIFPQTQSPKAMAQPMRAGAGVLETPTSSNSSAGGVSRTVAGHGANSDTEYVTSASKRRSAELRQQLPQWRDTSDINLLTRSAYNSSAAQASAKQEHASSSSWPTSAAPAAAATKIVSPAPTAVQPTQTSTVLGSQSQGSASGTDTTNRPAAALPVTLGSLVVGSLYTLIVDAQGRPAFVPVLADQLGAAGVSASPSNFHTPGAAASEGGHGSNVQERRYEQQNYSHQQHRSPPVFLERNISLLRGAPARRDPYESNFTPASPDEQGPTNSLDIDLHQVLHRALHEGSLSAEKTKRWRERDPAAASSSLFPTAESGSYAARAATAATLSPVHKKASYQVPASVPAATARYQSFTPSSGPQRFGGSPQTPAPAFLVGLGADGREQLLPPASYWKERLLQRNLSSALHSGDVGDALSTSHLARTPSRLSSQSYIYNHVGAL